jgi:hypothetical protein
LREDFVVFGQVPDGQTTQNGLKNIANLPKDVSPERGARRHGGAGWRGGRGPGLDDSAEGGVGEGEGDDQRADAEVDLRYLATAACD